MSHNLSFDVVIPTIGRPSLQRVLHAVVSGTGPTPASVVVVDDRPAGVGDALDIPTTTPIRVVVRRSYGSGPAAARNVGWQVGHAEWVAFLDDDVVAPVDWRGRLADEI